MSKANKDGWIRHRAGRKCPVESGVKVDYRMRSKKEAYGERAELLDWGLDNECPASDIMAYRLHKPAEQPYVRDDRDIASDPDGILIVNPCDTLKAYKPAEQVEPSMAVIDDHIVVSTSTNAEFPFKPAIFDSQLQWRDRIAEIDIEVQARTVERAELVQKLASEGFALIGRTAETVEDMSDWRNWKVGDFIVRVSDKKISGMPLNEVMKINRIDSSDPDQPARVGYGLWPYLCDVEWHSRPST